MKKFILFLVTIIAFVACEPYCPYCEGRGYCDYCGENRGVTYTYDKFYADKLIGVWQCSHNTSVGNINLKEITFIDNRKCDIVYSVGKTTDWYTETYSYSYSSGYIRFTKNGVTFSFHMKGYIYPELYVEDSFGQYNWHKVI